MTRGTQSIAAHCKLSSLSHPCSIYALNQSMSWTWQACCNAHAVHSLVCFQQPPAAISAAASAPHASRAAVPAASKPDQSMSAMVRTGLCLHSEHPDLEVPGLSQRPPATASMGHAIMATC